MKSKFLILILLTVLTVTVNAQPYKTALGVRFGPFNGVTVKHFVSDRNALEGLASFRWGGFMVTGLYEWQNGIRGASGLDYYLGLGAHVGTWNTGSYYRTKYPDYDNYTTVGLDFIAGLEYTFAEAPFNVSLDWKPAFNFGHDWWGDGLALSVRYTFR